MNAEESILKHIGLAGVLKGYGIYENVITAMEDYADQFRQAAVSGSLPIEFLEWTEKGMWTKWESRNDGYHEMTGWYNTHNFAAMKQPLSSQELFDLFILERSKQ